MRNKTNFINILLTLVNISLFTSNGFSQEVVKGWVYVKFEQTNNPLRKQAVNQIQQELLVATQSELKPVFRNEILSGLQKQRLLKKSKSTKVDSLISVLSQWQKVQIPFYESSEQFIAKWKNRKGIDAMNPVYIRQLTDIPNDPLYLNSTMKASYERQYFAQGWDKSKSDTSIVIAIVDSGVNYNHEDLQSKMWRNWDEIPNNGIDDDENGWIDDDKGWDFWESGEAGINNSEDNDPNGQWEDHGSHVAGIAAAESNNLLGLPGAGWNAKYMAVKAGGTQENPRSIAFGYEGILYAAANGADVINCSWGGSGSSQMELDVINTALELGCLIVAAAGNDGQENIYFPAAYPGVLAVGSMSSSLYKSSFSNYGYRLDVMATGQSITSASFANKYAIKSGTSMATPFVSGLAALLKSYYPDWTPAQYINQIRASSTYIDPANLAVYKGKLGRGGINAEKVLGSAYPGFRVIEFKLFSLEGNKLRPNQQGVAKMTIEQTGISDVDTDFSVTTSTSGVYLSGNSKKLPNIGVGNTIQLEIPIELSENFSPFTIPVFKIEFKQSKVGYVDYNYISYDELVYEEHNNGNIRVSVASDGTVGFVDASNSRGGIGFIPKVVHSADEDPHNMLFSASLMIREGVQIADRAINTSSSSTDIIPETFYSMSNEGNIEKGFGISDISRIGMTSLHIQTRSFTINESDVSQVLWLNYFVTNPSDVTADSIFVGMYADWDIEDYILNKINYLPDEKFMYVYDEDEKHFAGIAILNPIGGALAIDNAYDGTETDTDFGVYYSSSDPSTYNGFTKTEKLKAMSAGLKKTTIPESKDVSFSIYSEKFDIPAGKSASYGFVWVYGRSFDELMSQFNASKNYSLFTITTPETVRNEEEVQNKFSTFSILGNYPNPFNPTTNLKIISPNQTKTHLLIFDVLGRIVSQKEVSLHSGENSIPIDLGIYSSGLYLVRMNYQDKWYKHTMLYLK